MNAIRDAIGALFQSPMERMSFPAYFNYVNTAGKITARSIMETQMVILTFLEEQEQKNAQHEADFAEVQAILERLTAPVNSPELELTDKPLAQVWECANCGKALKTEFGLKGHMTSHNVAK